MFFKRVGFFQFHGKICTSWNKGLIKTKNKFTFAGVSALLFAICYMPLPGMLFHPSWHTSIPSLCLAITTHLKIYFTWFFQPKMDRNDIEQSLCFINSPGINTLAGNLSVSQSYASLNFTIITVDSASKFTT